MDNKNDLRKKMLDYVDKAAGLSNNSGMVKTAHPSAPMTNTSYKSYRSSFLTLADMEIPDDYREIFKWCRFFFKFDPLIGAAVRSLATFPVTDWVMNDTEAADEKDVETDNTESEEASDTYKFYNNMLNELNLYNHMIEVGYDYYLYGNCIIFAEPGIKEVKRRDKETGEIYKTKEVVWKNIQRLDVTRVRKNRDPKSGETIYYYDIPPNLKTIIKKKKPEKLYKKIPKVFKQAVEKNAWVKLNSKYVYSLQMPSESGDENLWSTPPVLHAMKLILYSNVLRQGQEAIAREHIIPKRTYYFQETNEFTPNYNFEDMAAAFAMELKKQLDDPNYQIVSPFPVQMIQHGGQGKALMLVPELEQLQETILAAMGVPREFVFGGVSYTGSTTSLRILENHFITYRTKLLDYINDFLIKGLAEIRGEWETVDDDEKLVKVTLADLKMQDDIQQKQLMIQLNQQGKLPDEVLYEDVLGLESTKTIKQVQSERMRKLQEQFDVQMKQLEYQAQLEQTSAQMGQPLPADPSTVNAQEAPQPAPGALDGQEVEEGAETEQQSASGEQAEQSGQQETAPGRENREAAQIAQQMMNASEAEQAQIINKLPQPLAKRVMMIYTQLKQNEEVDMRPMPEKLPPRRQGGV